MSPFAFLAIGIEVATIVFNIFAESFIELRSNTSDSMIRLFDESYNTNTIENEQQNFDQEAFRQNSMEFLLRYFNIFSFFILPIYTLVAKCTFWKENNYAEHLVINSYIQGSTYLFSTVLFVLAVYVHPSLYSFSIIAMTLFYGYVYFKFYKYSLKNSLVAILKFTFISIFSFILVMVAAVAIGILVGLLLAITGNFDQFMNQG